MKNKKGKQITCSKLVWFMLFLLPFCYPFRPLVSRIIHLHVYIIMYSTIAVILIYLLLKSNFELVFSKAIGMVFIYYCFFCVFSLDIDTGLKWIINVFIGMILGCLFAKYQFKWKDGLPYVLGTLLCSTILLPKVIIHFNLNFKYLYIARVPFMDGDISIGPNSWAQTISLAFLILLLYLSEQRKYRIFTILILGILAYFLFLTGSRTQTYALLCVSFLFAVKILFDKRENIGLRILFLMAVLGAVFAAALLIYEILKNTNIFHNRLLSFDLNGREDIWGTVLKVFLNDMNVLQMLLGTGTGSSAAFLFKYSTAGLSGLTGHLSAHNIYLDSLISSGILGTILAIGYWIRATWILLINNSKLFIFPLFILISGIGAHLFLNWEYCMYIAITECSLYSYNKIHHNLIRIKILNK